MDKKQMAHEYALIMLDKCNHQQLRRLEPKVVAEIAFDLVDAMDAEERKRIDTSRPEAIANA